MRGILLGAAIGAAMWFGVFLLIREVV